MKLTKKQKQHIAGKTMNQLKEIKLWGDTNYHSSSNNMMFFYSEFYERYISITINIHEENFEPKDW